MGRCGSRVSAGHVTALITLAPPCSAALAAGRLASRRTILLNKSALSHSDRPGCALRPGLTQLFCLFVDASSSALLVWSPLLLLLFRSLCPPACWPSEKGF